MPNFLGAMIGAAIDRQAGDRRAFMGGTKTARVRHVCAKRNAPRNFASETFGGGPVAFTVASRAC